MSRAELVGAIARRVLRGEVIQTPTASVGLLFDGWVCLDWSRGGTRREGVHEVPHIDEYGLSHTFEPDLSPFGAALAFLDLVGEGPARAALEACSS